MGQGFGTIPNSALIGPQGTFIGSPDQVLKHANSSLPSTAQMIGDDPLNPKSNPDATANVPKIGTPSFQQAAQEGARPGAANALSPGLSKAGKLVTLLSSGLQGALAGRQAQEQEIAQTGGRRAGGVGTGFEAGYQLPWQRAMQGQQLQQAQAQTALTQQQSQMVQTPYGMLPTGLAKVIFPAAIRGQAQENVQQQKSQTAQSVAGINKRFVTVPNVGLFDTQQRQMIPGTAQGVTITPDIAKDYGLPDSFVGKPMTLSGFSSLENAQRFNEQPVEGTNGPALVNRNPASPKFGQVTPLGLGNPSLGRAVQVGDPNNPSQTKYMIASQAVASGAPGTQSASVQVPKAAAKAEVPSKIGDQKLAFTTAMQHADLLTSAVRSLGNGDQQTLNALKNRFNTEFGGSGPITTQAIADAYGREITSMLAKGHMTDAEVGNVGQTLNVSRQSPEQTLGVIQAYRQLAQSKLNMLNQQKQNAVNQSQKTQRFTDGGVSYNIPVGMVNDFKKDHPNAR